MPDTNYTLAGVDQDYIVSHILGEVVPIVRALDKLDSARKAERERRIGMTIPTGSQMANRAALEASRDAYIDVLEAMLHADGISAWDLVHDTAAEDDQ